MTEKFLLGLAQICTSNCTLPKAELEHFIQEEIARDTPTGPVEVVDAVIDAIYYLGDTICQFGHFPAPEVKKISEFTQAAREIELPTTPVDIPQDKLNFVFKMMLSECIEGLKAGNFHDALKHLSDPTDDKFVPEIIFQAAKLSVGLEIFNAAFDEVHSANMRKGVIVDGKLTFQFKDVNGQKKIIKPAGWVAPDLHKAIGHLI